MIKKLFKQSTGNEVYAWHFSTGELSFDYEGISIVDKLLLKTQSRFIPDKSGFRARVNPLDALRFFAIRPNDNKFISRVKLSVRRREHLWVADAQDTLEDFALSYIDLIFDWLKKDNIPVPDIIFEALNERKLYLNGNSSHQQVFNATAKLLDYAKENENPFTYLLMYEELSQNKKVSDIVIIWRDYWTNLATRLPIDLARSLGHCLRRDTQFFVFDCLDLAYRYQHILCNYHAWSLISTEDPSNIYDYIEKITNLRKHRIMFDGLDAPDTYLKNCKFKILAPKNKLHQRLMQLAPADYKEPPNRI